MNGSLIITHYPGVERSSYVVRQFIVLPYWRHLLRLAIAPPCILYPTKSLTNPTQAYSTLSILFPITTLPQPIPCPIFIKPTHILLYSTLPCILYTTHTYTLPYSTLTYRTLHTLPQTRSYHLPATYNQPIPNPTHTLSHHIHYPTL